MRYILMQGIDDANIEFYYVMDDSLQNVIEIIDENCNPINPYVSHQIKQYDVIPPCAQ